LTMLAAASRLSVRRAASAVAPLVAARGLCAPAVPLIDEVRADLAMMKEKIGEAKGGGDYTVEAFTAALNAGTVDTGLLSSTMDFSDEARKLCLKLNMQTATMKKEMETPVTADFSAYEGKIDASVISQVQAIYESELAAAQSGEDPNAAELARIEKEISAMFHGPDGLLEAASKEEKAAEAGLLQCIADMEKIELDVTGVADVTIGEILDREPELRAEIEEEIKNNVWAP